MEFGYQMACRLLAERLLETMYKICPMRKNYHQQNVGLQL